MAYADNPTTNRRVATIGAVALLHAGVIVALVNGLSFVKIVDPENRLRTIFIDVEKPKPTQPPPQPKQDKKAVVETQIDRVIPPISVDVGQAVLPALPDRLIDPVDSGFPTGGGAIETPSPVPSFTPKLARPRGNTGGWVTPLDYPASELRAEHQGISVVRATVGIDGRVNDCAVVRSSGFPLLDSTACRKLADRARFEPASDSTGAKVEGSYTATIRWVIPE